MEFDPLDVQANIKVVCESIADLLIRKNQAYGNSAFDPVNVFFQLDHRLGETDQEYQVRNAKTQMLVRMDDKLCRIKRGLEDGEDVYLDLVGYLVLFMVFRNMAKSAKETDRAVEFPFQVEYHEKPLGR